MIKISTWNVNSVRSRLELIFDWLSRNKPDFLCLQETKVQDKDFPVNSFSELGYIDCFYGQKAYNGVSIHILNKENKPENKLRPIITYGFPNEELNEQKRVITTETDNFYLINVYVPQGEDINSNKFEFKLIFLDALKEYVKLLLAKKDVVITGDFNIAADERDIYNPEGFKNKVMFHPKEHAFFEALKFLGMSDSLRILTQEEKLYTWWDYRGASLQRNNGIRLDYIWLSENISKRVVSYDISSQERTKEKPSDHVPFTIELDI